MQCVASCSMISVLEGSQSGIKGVTNEKSAIAKVYLVVQVH